MKLETKVGLFVAFGLVFMFALTTQVNSFKLFNPDGYPIYSYIGSVDGLEQNAKVKANGMTIGSVESFELDKKRVIVSLKIHNGIKIPTNSVASLKQESMLGVKYFDISLGDSADVLNPNDFLFESKRMASFDETSNTINDAAGEFNIFIKKLNQLIDDNQKNFNEMIANFNQVGKEFKQTGQLLNAKLPTILDKFVTVEDNIVGAADKFGAMSSEFKQTGEIINKDLPVLLTKFEKAEDHFNGMMEENRANLKSAIKNIDNAFDEINTSAKKVGNAFDKLDTYLSSTTQSQLGVAFHNEYMVRDGYNKVYFGVDYSPKPTIHYLVDLVSADDYRDDGTNTSTPKTTKLHQKGRTLVSAQYAKDFNDLRLRAGIIESTGGVGADYTFANKKLTSSLDVFDFNAYNDVRGTKPHVKASVKYNLMKHVNVYGGYDNVLNSKASNLNFGLGVNFVDQDLKYLIGSSGGFVK